MNKAIKDLVESIDELASLPGVCGRISVLVEDPDSTIKAMAQVISQDQIGRAHV